MGNDFSYLFLPSVLRLKHGEALLGLWRRADGDGQAAAQEALADLQLEQAHEQHQVRGNHARRDASLSSQPLR